MADTITDRLGTTLGPAGQILAGQSLRRIQNEERANNVENQEYKSSISERASNAGGRVAGGLRQAVNQAKTDKASAEKDEENKGMVSAVTAPARQGTNWLLRLSWTSMPAVVTFIPALFYINLHVFLRLVLGENFFCKLGDEWIPKQIKAMTKSVGIDVGRKIGLVEMAMLLILDFICFIAILAIIIVFAVVYNFIYETWTGWGIRVITPGV